MLSSRTVVVGFIPLLDCAPLVVALEKGFAAAEGIDLTLVRESSWANIRDRVVVGHFDAAHMLGPMAIASTLGIGHLKVPTIAPLSLGLGGNAITVSHSLWDAMTRQGARSGADPRSQGNALQLVVRARERENKPPLTFAMVYPFSAHNYELRYWLAACGVDPDRDVRLLVIPPPLLVDAMREGQVDGFCVGEPWNSLAVSVGVGCIVTPTTAIWPLSAEKVLGCRLEWAQRRPDLLAALIRSLYRAAHWCEAEQNQQELAMLLSQLRYVGAPAALLQRGITNRLRLQPDGEAVSITDFYLPARQQATFPWTSHALWFYSQMIRWGQVPFSAGDLAQVRATFRPDLYRLALAPLNVELPAADSRIEHGFFDGRAFDPDAFEAYLAQSI
jgi:NitT/TauT family transport system ATP-binding protein